MPLTILKIGFKMHIMHMYNIIKFIFILHKIDSTIVECISVGSIKYLCSHDFKENTTTLVS
jgi:hypothetical protein